MKGENHVYKCGNAGKADAETYSRNLVSVVKQKAGQVRRRDENRQQDL